MITNEQQYYIHQGDHNAFKQLFQACGRDVYLRALEQLADKEAASAATKQTFLLLRNELMRAPGPVDVSGRLDALLSSCIAAERAKTAPKWDAIAATQSAEPPEPFFEADAPHSPPQVAPEVEDAPERAPAAAPAAVSLPPRETDLPVERSYAWLVWLLVGAAGLLLLWVLCGMLMGFGVVPKYDLGYSWFNENLFLLFWS